MRPGRAVDRQCGPSSLATTPAHCSLNTAVLAQLIWRLLLPFAADEMYCLYDKYVHNAQGSLSVR